MLVLDVLRYEQELINCNDSDLLQIYDDSLTNLYVERFALVMKPVVWSNLSIYLPALSLRHELHRTRSYLHNASASIDVCMV